LELRFASSATGSAHLRSLNDFSFARFEKPVISGRFQAVSEIPKPLEKQSVPNQFIIPLFDRKRKDFGPFFRIFLSYLYRKSPETA
jgi:hypothetical protein